MLILNTDTVPGKEIEAREQALDRMIDEARNLGADAVVAVRFETSTITQAASEILAYGTAVKVK
ncbi:MAG: heavy metal-binding domain-containing protein [Maritimibacter sp.]